MKRFCSLFTLLIFVLLSGYLPVHAAENDVTLPRKNAGGKNAALTINLTDPIATVLGSGSVAAFRTALGLGTAATASTSAFDSAGTASSAAAAVVGGAPANLDTLDEIAASIGDNPTYAATVSTALSGKQPLAAALTTLSSSTAAFLGLSDDANAAALRTTLGLGTAATAASTAFDSAGAAASAQAFATQRGNHTGSEATLLLESEIYPDLRWKAPGLAAEQRNYQMRPNNAGDGIGIYFLNDAQSVANLAVEWTRTGSTPVCQWLSGSLAFEGTSIDANETTLTVTDPTADRTITVPDRSGIMAVVVSASASLDYPSIAANAETTLTITVTGAATSGTPSVELGWSAALTDGVVVKQPWVSATNTVSVRVRNVTGSAIDPSAVTCRATVTQF